MTRARLLPIYFDPGRDAGFNVQLDVLKRLLAEEAEFLPPVALGRKLPKADAVVFPQLLGEAYRAVKSFKSIRVPILILTSEFGTESMWDWEIVDYLRTQGVETIAPYDVSQTRAVCRALALRRDLARGKLLVFQDNPGEGAQAGIFKRFYWWEDECLRRMKRAFGVTVTKKSWRALADAAKHVSDAEARKLARECRLPVDADIQGAPLVSALKLYVALKREAERDGAILAAGINCLNESNVSDTTPCLAFCMLFEERGLVWGCEGDVLSMLSMVLLRRSLGAPLMTTNLYPFLMGQAALKHEKIADFPDVASEPENHVLVAHCGYFGLTPKCFTTEWNLRRKVLAIVDANATAVDARFPLGPVTLAKLDSTARRMTVVEGELESFAQFPGSDCRNGGVIRVHDGHRLMASLVSHHYVLMTGRLLASIRMVGRVLGVEVDEI